MRRDTHPHQIAAELERLARACRAIERDYREAWDYTLGPLDTRSRHVPDNPETKKPKKRPPSDQMGSIVASQERNRKKLERIGKRILAFRESVLADIEAIYRNPYEPLRRATIASDVAAPQRAYQRKRQLLEEKRTLQARLAVVDREIGK